MTPTPATRLWSAYVLHITDGKTQDVIAEAANVNQATVSRWINEKKVPTEAANVAFLARAFGRNPLEAFVAAGMLEESEAGQGLSAESRRLLSGLKSHVIA